MSRVPHHLTGEARAIAELIDRCTSDLIASLDMLRTDVTDQFRKHDTDLREEIVRVCQLAERLLGGVEDE